MILDKDTYLVKGRASSQLREKIRLKLRLLLNKHKNPRLIVSDFDKEKLRFELSKIDCKTGAIIYSSLKYDDVYAYWKDFSELYYNEWVEKEEEALLWLIPKEKKNDKKSRYNLLVAFKSAKKSY